MDVGVQCSGICLDYRLWLWASTSESRAFSAVAELLAMYCNVDRCHPRSLMTVHLSLLSTPSSPMAVKTEVLPSISHWTCQLASFLPKHH